MKVISSIRLEEQKRYQGLEKTELLGLLHDDYSSLVRSVVYKMCRLSDPEDLVQEVFIKVWRALDKFHNNSSYKTWIYKIAVNTCLNYIRSQKRVPDMNEFEDQIASANENHENKLAMQGVIQEGLQSLNENQRALIVLCVYEGLSIKEAAEVMSVSEGTIKSRLYYAKEKMYLHLKNKGVKVA